MIKRGFEWLNTTLVGMVHKCPYKALKFMNATYAGVISDDIPSNWQVLPNGIYKIQLRVSDSFDDKIAEVIFCQESNIRKRRLTDLNMWQLINLIHYEMTIILDICVCWLKNAYFFLKKTSLSKTKTNKWSKFWKKGKRIFTENFGPSKKNLKKEIMSSLRLYVCNLAKQLLYVQSMAFSILNETLVIIFWKKSNDWLFLICQLVAATKAYKQLPSEELWNCKIILAK